MSARGPLAVTSLTALALAVGAATAAPGDVARVSVPDVGAAPNTQPASDNAAVSADGGRVAFTSLAQLTSTATGGKRQLYVRDLATGRTLLASSDSAGVASLVDVDQGLPINPEFDLSGNGRYAVYGTANAVFRKDLETGASLPLATTTVPPDPSVSYDGNRIVYRASLSSIVMRDVAAGTTTPVSVSSQGVPAQGANGVEAPSISADGRVVVFEAVQDGHGLVPPGDDAAGANDIIVRDTVAGTTVAASLAVNQTSLGGNRPDISGDGRYVVFQSSAKLDPVNDTNAGNDVYRRDVLTRTTVLVSAKTGSDASGATDGFGAAISADGSRVAFTSNSADLVGGDTNAVSDVFVRDVGAKTTRRISTKAGGVQAANASAAAAAAPNGGRVAFTYSDAGTDPLLTGDDNNADDVFATELAPSDASGPAISLTSPADGATVNAPEVAVSGVAVDPAGVAALSVAGQPVSVGAGGAFSATVPLGAPGGSTPIAVVARDGAGNPSSLTATVVRAAGTPAPAASPNPGQAGPVTSGSGTRQAVAKRPAVRSLSVSVRRGRVVVRFNLTVRSKVRLEVLRSRKIGRRTRFVRTGKTVTKTLAAGRRSLTVAAPKAGTFRVRLTATAGGRSVSAAKRLVVRPR